MFIIQENVIIVGIKSMQTNVGLSPSGKHLTYINVTYNEDQYTLYSLRSLNYFNAFLLILYKLPYCIVGFWKRLAWQNKPLKYW